ncbi:MAG: cysteine desulfurase [Treponema sp.]|jgi:cysteine desulfurase|nr:cysteine desulfurase [Treponema sp.]
MIRRYFDWAATAPALPLSPDNYPFGNPSSQYREGREAKQFMEDARLRCAKALGVESGQLVFTSGGTESNAIVLFSLLTKPRREAGETQLLYSAAEHPSVKENAAILDSLGIKTAAVGIEAEGAVSVKTLSAALKKNGAPRMATIMAVNNETGAVNNINELASYLRAHSKAPVHIHCDFVQAAGKIPLPGALDIDSAAISAHKLGGPRGSGLLYIRRHVDALVRGGGQENGLRPGTENVCGAAATAAVLEKFAAPAVVEREYQNAAERMETLVSYLADNLAGSFFCIPAGRAGKDKRFSPWILQCRFSPVPGEVMVRRLDEEGFAVSTGSACSSASKRRPVLQAMGIDLQSQFEGIRISQGWSTTRGDIEALAKAIAGIVRELS